MSPKLMRSSLLFALALLLTAGLAWADGAAPTDAVQTDGEVALAEGGGCMLPDLAGLSDEEADAALREAGFGVSDVGAVEAAAPLCPTRFSCSSLVNCGIAGYCSLSDIGPCCTVSTGLRLCCIQGSIKVRTCPCGCTAYPCESTCPQSSDVQWSCS
jgi:hypothetical protein